MAQVAPESVHYLIALLLGHEGCAAEGEGQVILGLGGKVGTARQGEGGAGDSMRGRAEAPGFLPVPLSDSEPLGFASVKKRVCS